MYFKTIEHWGYKVSIGCMPDTPRAELEERAEQMIKAYSARGLNGCFLRWALEGSTNSIEYWLEKQNEYAKV